MPFDWLLTETPVAADLRRMLKLLEEAYEHPVDIEFTINFLADSSRLLELEPIAGSESGLGSASIWVHSWF